MAGKSAKTTALTLRVPNDLYGEMERQAIFSGTTIRAVALARLVPPLKRGLEVREAIYPTGKIALTNVPYVGTEPPKQQTWWEREQDRKAAKAT